MKRNLKRLMAEANAVIESVSVQDALDDLDNPDVVFVDIRDSAELTEAGKIEGAVVASRGHLEFFADPESTMHKREFSSGKRLLLYCASGGRSVLAAKTLYDMGVANVAHIAGGFQAWRKAGGRITVAD